MFVCLFSLLECLFEGFDQGGVGMFACLFVVVFSCLFVCLFVYLFICLQVVGVFC